MITVSFTEEEFEILKESLKYAQMYFDDRIASYPEPVRTPYYKTLKP